MDKEELMQIIEKEVDEIREDIINKSQDVSNIPTYSDWCEMVNNHINKTRYAWVVSDPGNPTEWPGLKEQLKGIELYLYRDVIRWKYREKLMKLVEEAHFVCCKNNPIVGIEAWGEENGTRWLLVPKENLEDEEKETIKEFLKVEIKWWEW